MQNIGRLKRREQTTYKPTDTWTLEDDLIFLKYCPSKRDRCFHMMGRDTGTRTHELLKLKIKDIVLTQNAESAQWYAEVMVNGKTGSRSLPMFYSIPFYKAWLEDHPVKNNPNAPLFCGSQNKKNFGRRLSQGAIYKIYSIYKEQYFAKLAAPVEEGGDPTVSPEDKKKIKALLEKPWNPYLVHRHTTLTKLAREKGLSDSYLESIAGWKLGSNMKQKYVHLHANESAKALLKIWGVELDKESDIQRQQATHVKLLKPKTCLNCNEINESTAKFCSKCKFVMSFDAYKETLEEKEKTAREAERAKRELAELKAKQEEANRTAEKRRYEIEDMQEKLKEVQKQIESLPGKLLSDMKRYEPEIVKEVKDKEIKNPKQILLELPKTKTWHGQAVLSKYALEEDQLNHTKNMLKECPEKVVEMLNNKIVSHQEIAKKTGQD